MCLFSGMIHVVTVIRRVLCVRILSKVILLENYKYWFLSFGFYIHWNNLKWRLKCYRCFPVNFAKLLRTPFSQNTSGRLLLKIKLLFIYNSEKTTPIYLKNTCARVFSFLSGLCPTTLLKKRLWHRWFPVNFAKYLRTPFLTERIPWQLLKYEKPF